MVPRLGGLLWKPVCHDDLTPAEVASRLRQLMRKDACAEALGTVYCLGCAFYCVCFHASVPAAVRVEVVQATWIQLGVVAVLKPLAGVVHT